MGFSVSFQLIWPVLLLTIFNCFWRGLFFYFSIKSFKLISGGVGSRFLPPYLSWTQIHVNSPISPFVIYLSLCLFSDITVSHSVLNTEYRKKRHSLPSSWEILLQCNITVMGLCSMYYPGGAVVKKPPASAGDLREGCSITGSGSFYGVVNCISLQYSCLENLTDREAWWATVHGAIRSQTWLRTHTACTMEA